MKLRINERISNETSRYEKKKWKEITHVFPISNISGYLGPTRSYFSFPSPARLSPSTKLTLPLRRWYSYTLFDIAAPPIFSLYAAPPLSNT